MYLLRDSHELKEQHPDDADVQQWAKDFKAVYDRAVAYAGHDPSLPVAKQEATRRKHQHAFEQELWQLCAPYAHTSTPRLSVNNIDEYEYFQLINACVILLPSKM